jgi:hypothetical protein
METIIAIFDSAEDALAAKGQLRREGFKGDSVTVMSSEPIEHEADEDEKPSRIGLFSILGAIIGAAAAIALTAGVSLRVGINTGGMPDISPWPFGIIVFELAMLAAILASLGRMIYEARLARSKSPDEYDTAVADGKIVVCVRCASSEDCDKARQMLAAQQALIR